MAIVLHKLWDVTVEGFLLFECKLFSSHAPKGSGSCPYAVLSIGFSIFYQKSHPSCKWAGCVFFLRKNTVLLAACVRAPLHAPVTVNDARPLWFFGWTLLFAGARVWFPVVAQISLGMLGKTHRSELTAVLYSLTWRITHWSLKMFTDGRCGGRKKICSTNNSHCRSLQASPHPLIGYSSAEARVSAEQQRHARPPP